MITINSYYKPFLFCLIWLFVCSSVHGENMGADIDKSDAGQSGAPLKDNKTEWTLGMGLGVFDYHLYPGAKQTNRWLLPAPYFTFRSPKFEVDRGIKSFIYNSEVIVIDVSADFGLPVDSDETLARKGMPDLDFVVQLGPVLEFLLNDKTRNYFDVRFEIPVRVAISVDIGNVGNVGYLAEPRITFNHKRSSVTGVSQKATLGLKFATQDYNAYYYDVAPEFATATRAEYKSEAGFGGSFVNYRITYKADEFVYWTFLRYQSLRGAEFEDSERFLV